MTGTESFIDSRVYLFGSEGGPPLRMGIGTYNYEFDYQIPVMIPSSYESARGHIRYNIEAKLDIPGSSDKEYKVPFKVFRNEDLNLFPSLKRPSQTEYIKTFCWCICRSSPLILTVTLPQGGYVPGETIIINISYNNGSSKKIDRTRVALKKVKTYYSHTPERKTITESESVVEAFAEGVNAGESKKLQAKLTIPQNLTATNSYYCHVVQMVYQLKIYAERGGCNVDPIELTMAIYIGTIPLNMNANVGIAAFRMEDYQHLRSALVDDDDDDVHLLK